MQYQSLAEVGLFSYHTVYHNIARQKANEAFSLCRCIAHRCHHWCCRWRCKDKAHSVGSQCIPQHTLHISDHSSLRGRYSHQHAVDHNKRNCNLMHCNKLYHTANCSLQLCATTTTVWVKKCPLRFSDIFPKRLGIFSTNFTCLRKTTNFYSIIFNYDEVTTYY